VPRIGFRPAIDGAPDCPLPYEELPRVGWGAPEPLPDEVRFRRAVAWHPDGLYVLVEIDDPDRFPPPAGEPVYCGDSVELYIDDDGAYAARPSYDDPGTVQLIAAAPDSDERPVQRGQRFARRVLGVWGTEGFIVAPRPGGYRLEAFVEATDVGVSGWVLAAGGRVGLATSVNVSTPDGSTAEACGFRLGQFFDRVVSPATITPCEGLPWCDVRPLCTPELR
jgi:hypothetical protein